MVWCRLLLFFFGRRRWRILKSFYGLKCGSVCWMVKDGNLLIIKVLICHSLSMLQVHVGLAWNLFRFRMHKLVLSQILMNVSVSFHSHLKCFSFEFFATHKLRSSLQFDLIIVNSKILFVSLRITGHHLRHLCSCIRWWRLLWCVSSVCLANE